MDLLTRLSDLLVTAITAVAALALLSRFITPPALRFARKRFLSEPERRILDLLEAALPDHRIMAQVAMGALLRANKSNRKRAYVTRNRFSQKIVDFVVVTRDTAEVSL